jgi:transposase
MGSIIKKNIKGRPYYYAVKSGRVNGKPRIVWQKYLGTFDDIVNCASGGMTTQVKEVVISEAGGVAALLRIADKIGLIKIIDEIVPKNGKGPSVGEYIVLATLNRVLDPCSKVKISEWYKNTILAHLWKHSPDSFSSQRFWDAMDLIDEEMIKDIQRKITKKTIELFKINPEVILYDTTNFFSFIATRNNRNSIAQRGRNKQKRNDLRQIGLALVVTKDFRIPLFHHVYEGNRNDQGLFPEIASELSQETFEAFGVNSEATLVFDKGNISHDAMERIIIGRRHFVCVVPKNTISSLFATPIEKFTSIDEMNGIKAFSTNVEIWNQTFQAVLSYSESFFTAELVELTERLQRAEKTLSTIADDIAKEKKKGNNRPSPTVKSVTDSVKNALSGEFLKDIIKIEVKEKDGKINLKYSIDQQKLIYVTNHQLGRSLHITSHQNWSSAEVIKAYRGLREIEEANRLLKDREYLRWQPSFHWTDQKLKVHGLYCILALLLATLAHKTVVEAGEDLSLPSMLNELENIREVALIYDSQKNSKKAKNQMTLSRMTLLQMRLAEIFELGHILSISNTSKALRAIAT